MELWLAVHIPRLTSQVAGEEYGLISLLQPAAATTSRLVTDMSGMLEQLSIFNFIMSLSFQIKVRSAPQKVCLIFIELGLTKNFL